MEVRATGRRLRPVVLGMLACVAFAVVLRLHTGAARAIDDLGQSAAAGAAAIACGWRATGSTGRRRTSWTLFAAALASWAAGELLWSYYELLSGHETPFPSLADLGFLLFPAFALPAVLVRESAGSGGRGRGHLRAVLDGTMVVASLFVLGWATSLGTAYHADAGGTFAFVVSLAYPASDVIMLTVLVLVGLSRGVRAEMVLLGAGLVLMAVADSGFTMLTANGTYRTGAFVDVAWFAGFLALGCAALLAQPAAESDSPASDPVSPFTVFLPYGLVVVAVAAELGLSKHPAHDSTGLVVIGLALGALVVRQLLVTLDNRRLALDVMAQREELSHRAFHDPLTGLANRALFYDRLTHALDLRHRDLRPVSVMVIDLDDFKAINDAHGHDAGDGVLAGVAQRMSGVARTGDTVARLGGDEFAILLEDDGDAAILAVRLLDALSMPIAVGDRMVTISASVGTTCLDPSRLGTDTQELLRQADLAMYAAKRAGKGTSVQYSPVLRTSSDDDAELREALAEDIRAGRISTVFQQIVRCPSGDVFALEALARWSYHGTPLLPAQFIPVAERAGLLGEFDLTVMRQALALAQAAPSGPSRVVVSTNLGLAKLGSSDLPARISALLAEFGLPPSDLIVEISEQTVRNSAAAPDALAALREIGVTIALDDFGVGYSNLAQLDSLRPDIVKLDRTFIAPLRNLATSTKLLAGVIDLAHDLDALVVGEGVETRRQLDTLTELGCDAVQGYLFGQPMSYRIADLDPHTSS